MGASQAAIDQGLVTKDPASQQAKKADLPGLDVSALGPLGISGISNPDGQNDGLAFDPAVHQALILGKINARLQALGLVNADGTPTTALTSALSGASTVAVTGVTVSNPGGSASGSLVVGGTVQLTATVAPSNATTKTVTWSSSNTAIATVSGTGLVTSVAAGSATVTALTTDGSKMATYALTVTAAAVAVTGVSVAPTTASVAAGSTTQLTATVAPATATNQSVTWSSSDTSKATVSNAGLVTGVAAGAATITVTTVDGAKTATTALTVTAVASLRMLTSSDLATGTGSDSQAYTLNKAVDASGNSSAVDTSATAAARYNLKLPAGVDGFVCFKVPASGRSSRIMLRGTLTRPSGPSYQVRRGIRISYSLQPQSVSGDGTSSGTDTNYAAVAAGSYVFMARVGTGIFYYTNSVRSSSGWTQIGTDTDPTSGGDLYLADAGEAGAGNLLEVYTSPGFVTISN